VSFKSFWALLAGTGVVKSARPPKMGDLPTNPIYFLKKPKKLFEFFRAGGKGVVIPSGGGAQGAAGTARFLPAPRPTGLKKLKRMCGSPAAFTLV